ncbi:ADP-ribosylglycohydrolase [Arthrobacter saudimassiliensis]|uniref:ADP-ribosylglycohydrolase n=1 Tax=Arthrobacter saudimassiliensis TaxID=1461584 RepID=A0A078MUN5_9MICC|nr:ADP-ribosylglycohydrolase [Arthrobacter saudimassiliensis]
MTSLPHPAPDSAVPSAAARIRGCLAGLLAADSQLRQDPASAARPADEAELALYTVDGLVEALQWANDGVSADETACLWLAYLRWARLRGLPVDDGAPAAPARPLDRLLAGTGAAARPDAPAGRALILSDMGTTGRPVNPAADDDGALLRSVPAGLIPYIPEEAAARIALNGAALTHGHPLAWHAAAALAAVVHALAEGRAPQAAVSAGVGVAVSAPVPELARALASAEAEGAAGRLPVPAPAGAGDGSGRRADVVLAAAVQAVLAVAAGAQLPDAQLPDDQPADEEQNQPVGSSSAVRPAGPAATSYRSAVRAAAAAGGPVAGAAAGALIGTWLGDEAVPAVSAAEPAAALDLVAADLIRVTGSAAEG